MEAGTRSIEAIFDEHLGVARRAREQLRAEVAGLASDVESSLARGGKVHAFGNRGSAADAQHFAAELMGHLSRDRRSLTAIALSTDTSTLTAIAYDYCYERVLARQVEALCVSGDVVVGISTSGTPATSCAA